MKNNFLLSIKRVLIFFLIGSFFYSSSWAFPFFPTKQEKLRTQFLEQFFAQSPTLTRLKIKKGLKALIEQELISIRFCQQVVPPSSAAEQNLLDQINGLIPQKHPSSLLQTFKQRYLTHLKNPLRFYQLTLDLNPSLQAYTFRPSRYALYSTDKFLINSRRQSASMKEILGQLFEQRTLNAALENWKYEPAMWNVSKKTAVMWFPPARLGQQGLQVKVDFSSRLIFADLQPLP